MLFGFANREDLGCALELTDLLVGESDGLCEPGPGAKLNLAIVSK